MSGYNSFRDYQDTGSDFSAQSFLVQQLINRIATTSLARVVAVTSAGEVAPVGLLDLQPMVHQVDGADQPTPHGVIHNVPYFRMQGGANAVIMDPQVGDIGIVVFCSRDITAVKRTKAPANPGSRRMYDWSDGIYIGGVLNGVPSQYFRFSAAGVDIVSPTQITLTAPNVVINANIATTGTLTNNTHDVGSTHRHTATQPGAGTSGVPQ